MCLYPKLIRNRKYIKNKKNGGVVPPFTDGRVKSVPIACQKCMECKKAKAREWTVRLLEEMRTNEKRQFVTLTFSTEELQRLAKEIDTEKTKGYELDNKIATLAMRRFLERWRKKFGKSIKHWAVTELGGGRYEHMHIHAILWTNKKEEISNMWSYGYVYIGDYVNEETAAYITKYIFKTDLKHKEYQPKILTSKGIGAKYLERLDSKLNKYNGKDTKETYTTRTGHKLALPIYYRNKIYTEEEKEKLWIDKLDKNTRWVLGVKIDMNSKNAVDIYYKTLIQARAKAKRLGYCNADKDWDRIEYENARRELIHDKRLILREPEPWELF